MSGEPVGAFEAALVIVVPEVEPLVRPFRLQYDPTARLGVPAHITINYPFLPGLDASDDLLGELGEVFGAAQAFEFSFRRTARFPDVIYLPPDPEKPFQDLIRTVEERFPESPPYGGAYEQVVPHLTVAQVGEEALLKSIEVQLKRKAESFLPVSCWADEVWLMDNRLGMWRKRAAVHLG